MEEDSNSSEQSFSSVLSGSKIMRDKKRVSTNLGEKHEAPRKRVKMRDLESLVQFSETRKLECVNDKENCAQWSFGDKGMSQVTEIPATMDIDASKEEKIGRNALDGPRLLDLNAEVCGARYSSLDKSGGCVENQNKEPLYEKQEREQLSDVMNARGINVDLNAEDVNTLKGHGYFKSKDVSESASCIGPVEEKDPMKIWKEMKRNGFVSSSHGGIPVPKKRGRKSKSEILERKMELAKKEQISRFTKIAAPSGLLNELNPGIINHVRNRKQVHSIIEALVTEKHERSGLGSKQASHRMDGNIEVKKRNLESMNEVSKHQPSFINEGTLQGSSGIRQARKYPITMNDSSRILEGTVCDRDMYGVEKAGLKNCVSNATCAMEDDVLALKLSSSKKASASSTNLSNEGSSSVTMVSSLSLKAATVASQWLELQHQDLKGRLSALRRSKRRVRSVINTELPFLISKEFANNQNFDPYDTSMSADTCKIADMHRARWTAIFDYMDQALSDEEKQLESWLNQIKEKQLLCDQGLHHVNWSKHYGSQQLATSENDSRVRQFDSVERELAVNAAAASIYSTCNYLLSGS